MRKTAGVTLQFFHEDELDIQIGQFLLHMVLPSAVWQITRISFLPLEFDGFDEVLEHFLSDYPIFIFLLFALLTFLFDTAILLLDLVLPSFHSTKMQT